MGRLSAKAQLVSIVVPTHNGEATIEGCLRSLLNLSYDKHRYEIVVVDAGSTDATGESVRSIADVCDGPVVRYVRRPSRDANAARNAGLASASGELVAFVDDDVVVPEGWLVAIIRGAARWPGADCLGGPVLPVFEHRVPRTCARHDLAGTWFDPGREEKPVRELWGGNMILRRSAVERVGGFRPGLPFQQEWEWQQRLLNTDGTLVYLPQAWIWHLRRRSDLRVGPSVRQFFLRGYIRGRLGPPIAFRGALQRALRLLLHAGWARCTRGLTESARQLGLACGALAREISGNERRSPGAPPAPSRS
jgi:glycosyltransferase involved in cell wall biosynthesis